MGRLITVLRSWDHALAMEYIVWKIFEVVLWWQISWKVSATRGSKSYPGYRASFYSSPVALHDTQFSKAKRTWCHYRPIWTQSVRLVNVREQWFWNNNCNYGSRRTEWGNTRVPQSESDRVRWGTTSSWILWFRPKCPQSRSWKWNWLRQNYYDLLRSWRCRFILVHEARQIWSMHARTLWNRV